MRQPLAAANSAYWVQDTPCVNSSLSAALYVASPSPLSIAVPYIVPLRPTFLDHGLAFARGLNSIRTRTSRHTTPFGQPLGQPGLNDSKTTFTQPPSHSMSDFNLVEPKGWEYDLQSVRLIDQRRWLL